MPVVLTHDDAGRHFGMLALRAGVGAILAVAGDVEDRPQFVLQLERFLHQLFGAGVMIDGRHDRERFFTGEENVAGMLHGWIPEKWAKNAFYSEPLFL